MTKDVFNDAEISVPCPQCSHETVKTIGWLKTQNQLTCLCGATIMVDAKEALSEIRQAEKELADLGSMFE
ncbi:hypothetical protein [Microbulbifer sp. HZ11]|uniref:hypothetical protein n=1 Tax=Microbulbifer sp. HZ11 TaxID=1453501 RepID=UPI0005BC2562|nr:hypothetical protein [Microbulbifer sp. HZ11]